MRMRKRNLILIGADTMCSLNNVVYRKSSIKDDLFRMLKTFSNNIHQICTDLRSLQGDRQ